MFCRTLVAFSTGMVVMGLMSAINAKPVSTPHARTGKVTVSSDSLQGLYGRDITDYPGLSQTSDEFGTAHPGLPIAQAPHHKEPPLFRKIGEQVKIDTGDQLGTQNTPEPLRLTQDNGEYNENFSVQYKLNR
ncbi:MAG: hypothetical protein JO235_22820 [Chroococcidiopsidaceae cyanobacterium CP_BM_RX_35]|nr:hypothetical protein [Chroococcidiopsidaceae cyanobacterium CP_BM_RX_35]